MAPAFSFGQSADIMQCRSTMSIMSVPSSWRKRSRSARISFSVEACVFVRRTTLSRATVFRASRTWGCVPYWSAESQNVRPWSTPARRSSARPARPRPRVWFDERLTPLVPVPWASRETLIPVRPRVTTSWAVFGFDAA